MEIVERTENSLLNRIEIRFTVNHTGKPTPTRSQLRSAAASLEPGSSSENVIVKQVETRFGQALTSGLALIYQSSDAVFIEPTYILERHGIEPASKPKSAATAKPAAAPAEAEAVPPVATDDVSGGEE